MSSKTGSATLDAAMFDGPASVWLPSVIRLLDDQGSLCVQLERLSREQTSHLAEGQTDALIGVLADRQQVLDRVIEINEGLAPFRDRRRELDARLGDGDRRAVQVRLDLITDSIERVRLRDDLDRAALERQRQAVGDELAGLARSRGAVSAYAAAGPGTPSKDRHG